MKNHHFKFILLGISLGLCLPASGTLLVTESFNYPTNGTLGSSATLGNTNWNGNNAIIAIASSAAQTAPAGFAAEAGRGGTVTNNNTKMTGLTNWLGGAGVADTAGNVLYASFLLNVRSLPTANEIIVTFHNTLKEDNTTGLNINLSSTGQLGVQKKSGGVTNVTGTPFASPGTHLVVARYTVTAVSGHDEVALWVDPASATFGGASTPVPGAATTNGVNTSVALSCFNVCAQNSASFVYWIDEIRLGTTWADVTPASGTVLPSTTVITNITRLDDGNLQFSYRGTSGQAYRLWATTNLALTPATNAWTQLTNDSFNGGAQLFADEQATNFPQRFYLISIP